MFKYVKTLNSGKATPEIVKIKVTNDTMLYSDFIYELSHGALGMCESTLNSVRFMPIESVNPADQGGYIHGFFVSSDMIFECNKTSGGLIEEEHEWAPGFWLKLLNVQGGAGAIDSTYDEYGAFIVDASDFEKTGKVLVKIYSF